MRATRCLLSLFLVAFLWIAQMQGIVHGISHLGSTGGMGDHRALTQDARCLECAAFAQAGAAPILAVTTIACAPAAAELAIEQASPEVGLNAAHAYRSRAPPTALS